MCQADESDPRYEERETLLKELNEIKNVNEKTLVKYIKKIKETYNEKSFKYRYQLKKPMLDLALKQGFTLNTAETNTQLFEMLKETDYSDISELPFLNACLYSSLGHNDLCRKMLKLGKEFMIGDKALYEDMIRKFPLNHNGMKDLQNLFFF